MVDLGPDGPYDCEDIRPQAEFSFANLSDTSLSSADLSGAFLLRANLPDADPTDSDLSGADLGSAESRLLDWVVGDNSVSNNGET